MIRSHEKNVRTASIPPPPKKNTRGESRPWSPVRLTSDFWPAELEDNKFVFFEATACAHVLQWPEEGDTQGLRCSSESRDSSSGPETTFPRGVVLLRIPELPTASSSA